MDGDLENVIIASSSEEEDNSMGHKTPTIRNSQTKKQPFQTAKKRNIEEDMEWVPSQQPTGAIKKVWSEKDDISEPVLGGPQMTKKEFQARYPRVYASIDDLPPYNNMTDQGKNVIKECMLFISPKEIEDLEDELMDYHEEEVERATKQMLLRNKQSKLLQKGTRFYNEAHQN
ncbi:hypothetical protein L1887_17673 [Cichorium endivia]|nr:hypothetical protein L1887_17673 [Cichorium endivia]